MMGQRLLLLIGSGMVAVAVALAVVVATAGWGLGPVRVVPGGLVPGAMMGPYGTAAAGGPTISMDRAQSAVQAVLGGQGNGDLAIDELIEFQDNFYASIREKSTGRGAIELLVDRVTGTVMPEPGPNMMWNAKYGMAAAWGGASLVGGFAGSGTATGPMTVTADQAAQAAQSWLDENQQGSTTETPTAFYGYYSVHLRKDGQVTGMLSVNGYTGQVWYHTWHGPFIQERDLGA
jgi:hypothetical protein